MTLNINCSICDKPFYDMDMFIKHHLDCLDSNSSKVSRFCRWFWSVDLGLILKIISGIIINTIFLAHSDFQFWEKILEAFCFGFLLMGILNQ